MPRPGPDEMAGGRPDTDAPPISHLAGPSSKPSPSRFGSTSNVTSSMTPPERNRSGRHPPKKGLASSPEETAAQNLTHHPALQAANAGSFNHRLQSSLIPKPLDDYESSSATPAPVPEQRKRGKKKTVPVPTYKERMGTSAVQGRKTVRLGVLSANEDFRASASAVGVVSNPFSSTERFTPMRLLDIENGTSILVTNTQFSDYRRYHELGDEGAVVVTAKATAGSIVEEDTHISPSLQDKINAGIVRGFNIDTKVGIIRGARRGMLRRRFLSDLDNVNGMRFGALDNVNGMRFSRQLQQFLPFLTGYEAYMLAEVIEAMDGTTRKEYVDFVLKIAFQNQSLYRILAQTIGPRRDFWCHWYQQVSASQKYDAFGLLPIIGFTSFPATENFPATGDYANRSALHVSYPQALAAENNGFELANRNQFGTYSGRLRTNQFRSDCHLPVDESIVRDFVAQPMPTLINTGVVHTLRLVAKHWHNILWQASGNFAHHRMEQLDPFETMRFHMPVVCVVLSSLRGRNQWDTLVLGPFIRKCQELRPSFGADGCRYLVREMQEHMTANLTAGVASVFDPLQSWLEAITEACDLIQEESKEVYQKVTSVEVGLRLGHDLITQVNWKIPSENALKKAILLHIRGKAPGAKVIERRIRSALLLTTPRDKRTLVELVKKGFEESKPAQLLLNRVKTLLQRDIRRDALNEAIRELSLGEYVPLANAVVDEWYWVEEREKREVYIYSGKGTNTDQHRFIHADSGVDKLVSLDDGYTKCRSYVPVAESISRAQRCYMNIELEHGKKFKYSAFMEFSCLRIPLRRLAVISQVFCEELDNARLNFLREVQRSDQTKIGIHEMEVGVTYFMYDSRDTTYESFVYEKGYTPADPEWQTLNRARIHKVPPQSMIVIGGGLTGLMTVIHCAENVLMSGGVMQLYEGRDAFRISDSASERAQIVRLDARWISMLRYHLGTNFEDVYLPASGEADAQHGNTLPTEGLVEITIKDLENMLQVEVSKMWSKGVVECHMNSKAKYNIENNALVQKGEHLKVGDNILRRINPDGEPSDEYFSWKVADLIYHKSLGLDDLRVGREYGIYVRQEDVVIPFKLMGVDVQSREYSFKAMEKGGNDLKATAHNLPSIYRKGTRRHAKVSKIVVESVQKGSKEGFSREELLMSEIENEMFTMGIGHTHVVECIGKPPESGIHFDLTTYEPYGVCCIQGLKVSMGMHNFGQRLGSGVLDDIRPTDYQNTRIIGDFTKIVRQPRIAELMLELVNTENWQEHFKRIVAESKYVSLDDVDNFMPKLRKSVRWHALNAKSFKRQTLQTRLFETGDNYCIETELTREYVKWKRYTADHLVAALNIQVTEEDQNKDLEGFKDIIMHHIDRLWYDACLLVIFQGDVYNSGAQRRVPRFYTINSYNETRLANLPLGESFRLVDRPQQKYEVVVKEKKQVAVRNVEGQISKMDPKTTMVHRESNLTRDPEGNQESKGALATFPSGHSINYRTVRLNSESRGYVFAFVGDEQVTPHFMRDSGLTGACINAMLFNDFVKQAIDGVAFKNRLAVYSRETNWSNSEVVTRGTGSNFGRDAFLRPSFAYKDGFNFLHSKIFECMETGEDLDDILSRDWKAKFAASLVPRGMELNVDFIRVLYEKIQSSIFDKFVEDAKADKSIAGESLLPKLLLRRESMEDVRSDLSYDSYWKQFVTTLQGIDDFTRERLQNHAEIAKKTEQMVDQLVDFATKGHLYNERLAAEMNSQPKPVDSIVDDFAVEAQNFANSLAVSAAFSAAALAFVLFDLQLTDSDVGKIFGSILGGLNIFISFSIMTRVSRYKIRNEEARILFFDEKLLRVLKAVFASTSKQAQDCVPDKENPFVLDLESRMEKFRYHARYYDVDDPDETGLSDAYNLLRKDVNNPTAIHEFQTKLTTSFIADIYHHNSYIQEDLVDVYKACSDILQLLEHEERPSYNGAAQHLFHRLTNFTPRLDNSLQRGRVGEWDIFAVPRCLWSFICCASTWGTNHLAPVETETLAILRETQNLSASYRNTILRREIRDLEYLYWATRERNMAAMTFVAAFLVQVVSWIFSICRIVTLADGDASTVVMEVASWTSLASCLAAILAVFHFQRRCFILLKLWCTLGGKVRNASNTDDKAALSGVKSVAFIQLLLTVLRLLAASGAAVALPWSVAISEFPDKVGTDDDIPVWIALGSVSAALLASIVFFLVEYLVQYNLSPRLGEHVCEAFREEIESIYTSVSVPLNDIETKQEQEREAWEYAAREFLHIYRFDTVFAADRFGSILQYIQSGMDSRS